MPIKKRSACGSYKFRSDFRCLTYTKIQCINRGADPGLYKGRGGGVDKQEKIECVVSSGTLYIENGGAKGGTHWYVGPCLKSMFKKKTKLYHVLLNWNKPFHWLPQFKMD